MYSVTGGNASPAAPIELASAGLRERDDLQEWVLVHPEILGDGIKVITFEFDRWQTNRGERQQNRLDVLGLDADGRLVLAELKRDRAPDNVQLQALNYAALVSRFTEQDVLDSYVEHRRRSDPSITEENASKELLDHAGELDPEVLRQPRVVLVAGVFSPVTMATVVWLVDQGLDITLQKIQAYRTVGGEIVVSVSQLFPVVDVEDFMVSPMRAEARTVQERRKRPREKSTVTLLIEQGALPDGTPLTLVPTMELGAELRHQILEWIEEDPRRGSAVWYNDAATPLRWGFDGLRYRPTTIVKQVVRAATGVKRGFAGPRWWCTDDGRSLVEIARPDWEEGFDWSHLHAILERIPSGTWASYGDLASVVGTAPQPLGGHLAGCPVCVNAHRVLGGDGAPRESFAWSDSQRTETQQDVLAREGVTFQNGRAVPEARIDRQVLARLADHSE